MAWRHESRKRARRREATRRLSMSTRLDLLRRGLLGVGEIRNFAADAGDENYIEAEAEVERLLDHQDPIVRYNAMSTVAYEWGRSSRADRLLEILFTDDDRECRVQAAGALGSLFRGKGDRHVLDALVGTARNPREPGDVRAFAYTAALDVIGVSRTIQPNPLGLNVGPDELLALDEYLKVL
jgi:hypothetical protein